ncbi:MAG: hypothetical protein IJT02_03790 [Synergistaceae bacterium]|nr:hypothetical protein [Synergistaceae bacterium]
MLKKDSKALTDSEELEELSLDDMSQIAGGDFGGGGSARWFAGQDEEGGGVARWNANGGQKII